MSTTNEISPAPAKRVTTFANDLRRNRELYRYLEPNNLTLRRRSSSMDVSKDTVHHLTSALTPLAQLAALRCNATKAMINVMDKDVMYFLAQASNLVDDNDNTESLEEQEDAVFMGCASVPLHGRVCEVTIRQEHDSTAKYPMFVVPDLSQDPRFSELDVVKGDPWYKFYAGTPITTPGGVNIGSLAVLDSKPRDVVTKGEEKCLGEIAAHIMAYLETHRQAIEGRRAERMGRGLDQFVMGSGTLEVDDIESWSRSKRRGTSVSYGLQTDQKPSPQSPVPPDEPQREMNNRRNTWEPVVQPSDDDHTDESTIADPQEAHTRLTETKTHATTFARAANLIRESLELGDRGGVCFIAAGSGLDRHSFMTTYGNDTKHDQPDNDATNRANGYANGPSSAKDSTEVRTIYKKIDSRPASILAFSATTPKLSVESEHKDQPENYIDESVLSRLIGRYQQGRLWTWDDDETRSSDTDEEIKNKPKLTKPTSVSRRVTDREYLRKMFPEARQLLMAPVWDPAQARYSSACFVWSSTDTRSLSTVAELSFIHSFCKAVVAECSRLDALLIDQQKSDFVGTISHEMRSPLHGILASVEFLSDCELTSFQKSLIDTIDSCGRTLLDTINHVLDYSKINSFEKNWQNANANKSRKKLAMPGADGWGKQLSSGAPPLLQLYGATDISAVVEEVVEGIMVGQTYKSGVDITDISRSARGRSTAPIQRQAATNDGYHCDSDEEDGVEILLDIEPRDWIFMTQPGALRRIVMNVFGNAIKYTSNGSIKVHLQLREQDENKTMLLTITDTGKGISQRFLSTKIFMPFAQENALAPGTGLGLSIVRSILTMLGGSIDIQSQINQGTKVQVALPLTSPLQGLSTNTTPNSNSSSATVFSAPDQSVQYLKSQMKECCAALYGFDRDSSYLRKRELGHLIEKYLRDWFEMQVVSFEESSVDIVILEEQDLVSFIDHSNHSGIGPALVVLCSDANRHSQAVEKYRKADIGFVEFIAKPCGPYKLARAVKACLDRGVAVSSKALSSISENSTPFTDSVVPDISDSLQEMDLGSPGDNESSNLIQAKENFAASQTSQNAQMAITSPKIAQAYTSDRQDSFPFPTQDERRLLHETQPSMEKKVRAVDTGTASEDSSSTPTGQTPVVVDAPNPRVLLVDDNKINLQLLQTFLQKRKYTRVSCAEDGQAAVDLVTEAIQPFEIIFMDISMPVMNGFEATRAIRLIEEERRVSNWAMIIALTGLASGRDQSEGFNAGCDIYMTKPVSFKEVGKLLDNWEAHQKLKGNSEDAEAITQKTDDAINEATASS